jgi:hypothetical protein
VDYTSEFAVIDCVIWKIKTKMPDGTKTGAIKIFNSYFPRGPPHRAKYELLFAEYLAALRTGFETNGTDDPNKKVLVCGGAAQAFMKDVNERHGLLLVLCNCMHPEAVFRLLGLKQIDASAEDTTRQAMKGVPGENTCTISDKAVSDWAAAHFGVKVSTATMARLTTARNTL